MLGAIYGDIIGSSHEHRRGRVKHKNFPLIDDYSRFTDDTVLTIAVAEFLLTQGDIVNLLKKYYRSYPKAGYGKRFKEWAKSDSRVPLDSIGNGSAMRVSPCAYSGDTLYTCLENAQIVTAPTHGSAEGYEGAYATTRAVYLARKGKSKEEIASEIEAHSDYTLKYTLAQIRPRYTFSSHCSTSVPQAITAYLEANSFEDAVRNAVSLGGDADTQACIAGAIAEAHWGVPEDIHNLLYKKLPGAFQQVLRDFNEKYPFTEHKL